jgi:hypothetical protein
MDAVDEVFQGMDNAVQALTYAKNLYDMTRAGGSFEVQSGLTAPQTFCGVAVVQSSSNRVHPAIPVLVNNNVPLLAPGGDPGVLVERWMGLTSSFETLPSFPSHPDQRFRLPGTLFSSLQQIGDNYGMVLR